MRTVACRFDHLFGKELFIRFTASAFCKLLSVYVFSYFPFGFEGRMLDLIVSVPDHCLSFYFEYIDLTVRKNLPCIPFFMRLLKRCTYSTLSKAF